jgi:hypothetical protein
VVVSPDRRYAFVSAEVEPQAGIAFWKMEATTASA